VALAGLGLLAVVIVLLVVNRRTLRGWYLLLVEFERIEDNAQGYPVYRHERTGLLFVRLPGGRVTLGCPPTEKGDYPGKTSATSFSLRS
jgi:hypothetical protein